MNRFIKPVLFSVILNFFSGSAPAAEARPNFVIIVADDLTYSDVGYEGSRDVKTPHLDQLRNESMHLRGMFDPATTCSPTRHSLYTGLYPIRSGAYPNHTRVYDGTRSLFTHLKTAGYRVALQGKSDVAPEASFPYEYFKSLENLTPTKSFVTRDAAQPWFLVYASHHPHAPWTEGPKYDPAKITVPAYLHDNPMTRQDLAQYFGEITALDDQVGALLKLLDDTKQSENTLVLFVSEQGSSFPYGGKWSVYDNGVRASAILRWPGKVKPGSSSDALMQYVDVPPTFLAAAGIDPTQIDVGCPDAYGDTGFDGRSFLPVLLGKSDTLRDYIFVQHTTLNTAGAIGPYPMRAVRDARYKLVRNLAPELTYSIKGIHQGELLDSWKADAATNSQLAERIEWLFHRPGEELYDLQTDPYEQKNLAANPEMAKIKARLQAQLNAWIAQQGDKGMETEKLAKTRKGKLAAAGND